MPAELSVIIPLRNVEAHLPTMLASLERNLDVDVELIAIDDCSTDRTPAILEAATERLPMLRVLRQPEAVGAASARNLGQQTATGRLFTYLDGDDWIAPGHFAALVEAIDFFDCDMVRTDHVQVHDGLRVVHRAPCVRNRVLRPREFILPLNRETMVDYPFSWAGVYKASLGDLLHWEDGLHTATDRPWIWQLHRRAASFATVSHAGVYYRREVSGSLTTVGDDRRLHFFDAYAHVLDQVRDEPDVAPKAVRQFLGVLTRHLSMLSIYEDGLRQTFDDRARAALAAIDPDVYRDAVMTDDRRLLLEPYLTVPTAT